MPLGVGRGSQRRCSTSSPTESRLAAADVDELDRGAWTMQPLDVVVRVNCTSSVENSSACRRAALCAHREAAAAGTS